ncbi:hypothetical protein AALM74_16655 [Parabacteroides segnis]|uniref:hypothetical protein n=1 Tax=Parabacteroides segnis TaxID=2763058 RepID=UPI0035195AA0
MFTQYMTDEELEAAAYRDFLEIRMKVNIAYERFCSQQNSLGGKQRVIHSLMQEKKVTTKSKNTWYVLFISNGYTHENGVLTDCYIYIPLYRGEEVDYLFMSNTETFVVERLSNHFLMRYKQRYIEYKGIKLRGIHPAVYYMIHNKDKSITYYMPENWTEKEITEKVFMISKQGLSLVKFNWPFMTYITFLDQENLSRYKAMIFEEETLWKDIGSIKDSYLSPEHIQALYMKHCHDMEHTRKVMERYLRRIWDPAKMTEENVQYALDGFIEILNQMLAFENSQEQQVIQMSCFEMPDIRLYLDQMKKGK